MCLSVSVVISTDTETRAIRRISLDVTPLPSSGKFFRYTGTICFVIKLNHFPPALLILFLPSQYTWCVQVLRSPKEAFAAAIQSWRERCEKCVCLQGDYVEKSLHFQLPVVSSFFFE